MIFHVSKAYFVNFGGLHFLVINLSFGFLNINHISVFVLRTVSMLNYLTIPVMPTNILYIINRYKILYTIRLTKLLLINILILIIKILGTVILFHHLYIIS